MSTEIKEIIGIYEKISSIESKSEYVESKLYLTRFYGGQKNRAMLQITITNNTTGYIQLTQDQIKELAQTLNDAFDYDKYPSE